MPRSRRRWAVTGPTPHKASTGSVWRKRSTRWGAITVRPSGFCHADAIFARNLFGATPADAVRPVRSLIAALIRTRDLAPERQLPRVLGHVEIRLVERQRLDPRRHRAEDLEHRLRRGAVLLEVGPDDRQVRAQADRARHRHRRAHAEGASLVAGRRHHAPASRAAADRHGLAAQRRVVALLDRRVEGVHVDVQDAAGHGRGDRTRFYGVLMVLQVLRVLVRRFFQVRRVPEPHGSLRFRRPDLQVGRDPIPSVG